jgi:8-oxo-dGTP pyrophosphatase MutT (NUDIX family)
MINGSFTLIEIERKHLFIKRNDNGLWDITGGGFDADEIDYTGVAKREVREEVQVELARKQLQLCAILGQRLKKEISEQYGGIQKGLVFLHSTILYEQPTITLGDEHSDWNLFGYEEITKHYKEFSSGILWMYFTLLSYHQTKKLQEGMLYDRRMWQGKEYV